MDTVLHTVAVGRLLAHFTNGVILSSILAGHIILRWVNLIGAMDIVIRGITVRGDLRGDLRHDLRDDLRGDLRGDLRDEFEYRICLESN